MNRIYSVLFLPLFFTTINVECLSDFGWKATSDASKKAYSIELKMKEGSPADYTFELYDLNTGALTGKKKVFFSRDESKVVFQNIKPSTYTVYFSSSDCSKKKSLKGTEIVLQ